MVFNRALTGDEAEGLSRSIGMRLGPPQLPRRVVFDTVTLSSGQTVLGEMRSDEIALQTARGRLSVPVAQLAGLLTAPTTADVWLVLEDGQVVRGRPASPAVTFRLSIDTDVQVPLDKLRMLAMKKRPPAAAATRPAARADEALVAFANGERLLCEIGESALSFQTACGAVDVRRDAVAAAMPQPGGGARLLLANGTRLSGTLGAGRARFKSDLAGAFDANTADIEALSISVPRPAAGAQVQLALRGGQLVVGTPGREEITLDGELGPVKAPLRCVAAGRWTKDGQLALRLADEAELTGRPTGESVSVGISQGRSLRVPLKLIEAISNAEADLPDLTAQKVQELIAQLRSEKFDLRDKATKALIEMGKPVVPTLRKCLQDPSAEVRQRVTQIIQAIGGDNGESKQEEARPRRPRIIF